MRSQRFWGHWGSSLSEITWLFVSQNFVHGTQRTYLRPFFFRVIEDLICGGRDATQIAEKYNPNLVTVVHSESRGWQYEAGRCREKISKSRRFLSPLDPDAVADYLSESGKHVLVMWRSRHEESIFSVKSDSFEANPRGFVAVIFLGLLTSSSHICSLGSLTIWLW